MPKELSANEVLEAYWEREEDAEFVGTEMVGSELETGVCL